MNISQISARQTISQRFVIGMIVTLVSALTSVAHAECETVQRICTVADPTGTPLNFRGYPNGKIKGTLKNGSKVLAGFTMWDEKERDWVQLIHPKTHQEYGWVLESYLKCK